jgi:hypothetical protein
MAVTNWKDIYEQVESEWSWFASEPDRAISEMADSLVPVYNGEIIREWTNLSQEDSDTWQEFGAPEKFGIVDLMKIDLFIFYEAQVATAYNEILEMKEEAN